MFTLLTGSYISIDAYILTNLNLSIGPYLFIGVYTFNRLLNFNIRLHLNNPKPFNKTLILIGIYHLKRLLHSTGPQPSIGLYLLIGI